MPNADSGHSGGSHSWIGILVALVLVIVLGTLVGRGFYGERPAEERHLAGASMGTTWSLKVVLPAGAPAAWFEAIRDTVQSRLDRIERLMSTWGSTTELSRFNRSADTTPQRLSPETIEVLSIARHIGERSGGALDVTVAPFVDAWGFGPGDPGGSRDPPSRETLDAMAHLVGPGAFRVDEREGIAAKADPGVTLDPAAVAKGYAVDRAAEGVAGLGATDFAIEVGGEVHARGARPDGSGWRVAVEAPVAGARSVYRVLELRDASVATSGDYRNFFEVDGVRFAHILDPRSGRPVRWEGFSITVIHEEAAIADAWATALAVLGPEEGLEVAEREGLEALFVMRVDGGFESRMTSRMEARTAG